MAAVVFHICEEAENARIFLRDTFFYRYLNQGQIRGHNIAFLWGCAHSSAQAKRLWGCIWLMCLTDRACGIGLLGIRAQRGVDFPDLLRFLKLLCGWWRENGSFSGVIFVFNVDSCFEPSLGVSFCVQVNKPPAIPSSCTCCCWAS